jgi:catechol 2,3-dioxygenase-like lactoylglutathione lyase family enzyme
MVLHHAAVFVEDLDRAVKFYSDLLGLQITKDKRKLFHLAFELPRDQKFEEFLARVKDQ